MGNTELTGKVIKVMPYGAFVKLDEGKVGLIHVSQLTDVDGVALEDPIKEGDRVLVKVNGKDKSGKLNLVFIRKVNEQPKKEEQKKTDFEQLLKKFLKESQESLVAQKRRIKRHRGEAA
ncbi:MAG: S1 RNA-binding domain-containing protein [Caldisericum exile]|uniref:S1 RNA-binding domain-containing protein n=1 Tax=Caldisericum exile TaxID=693075 RepID=UPI003C77483B